MIELKELCDRFKGIIGTDDLLIGVRDALLSDRKDDVLRQYTELVEGDLTTDELQKIFQYYYADRKEKCQDFTPRSIGKLCTMATDGSGTVYDLCAGSGSLTIQAWVRNPNRRFICEELDEQVIPLLLFNLAVRNIGGYVINRNSLTMEMTACYKLTATDRFSTIEQTEEAPTIEADAVISNPPYNIRWDAPAPLVADERFTDKPIPPASNANFAFVMTALHRMKEDGRCAFVLPCGVLTGEPEKEIRQYLIDSGLIERVITLPDKMFEATQIPTCVIVFSRGNKSVMMVDARRSADTEQRAQNGQFGGASHERRTYIKTVNTLSDETINEVLNAKADKARFSACVDGEQIKGNDYNIATARYIAFPEEEQTHRPYAEIIADINRVARERSVLKITINENMAKEFGLYEVAKLIEQEDEERLNKTLQLVGGHYEGRRYITLTKSKELKIENQDKEILSSLLQIFVPMLKQHILYLNGEENRLLAELRDAMLPDLMSGKIEV